MDSIVYGNLRIEILAEHGGRIQRTTLQAKPPAIRARRRPSVSDRSERLLGRDAEVAAAVQAIDAGEPIEFLAACGFGKSTLLWHLAVGSGGGDQAVVYLRIGGQRLDDLLQSLIAAVYATDGPFKPTPEQRAQLLAQARVQVLLDDVTLRPSQLQELLDALPECGVLLGSDRPVLGRRGRSIALKGLPGDAALELLRRDLGRDLTASERADAERLCELVAGQPLHLRQAAALVREGRHSFADLVHAAEGDVFALDRLSVNALAESERRVLAVLALAAGALLPTDLLSVITKLANAWGVLDSLHRRGLVEREGDRFGLPVCHAEDYRGLLQRYLGLGEAARELATWVQRQSWTGQQARSAAEAALQVIGYAAERGEWSAVVDLVEAVEPVLALAGQWEAWRDVLGQGLEAAQAVGDVRAEAHLAHQLGTLEFALDRLDQARELWQRALRLRQATGDEEGAEVTRANLALLTPPARPHRPRRRPRVPSTRAIASAVAAVLAIAALLVPLARSRGASPTPTTAVAGAGTSSTSPRGAGGGGVSGGGVSGGGVSGGGVSGGGVSGGGSAGHTGSGSTSPGPPHASVGDPSAKPEKYQGNCPVTISFAGTIAVDRGPVKVSYRWIRSDGAIAPIQTLTFPGSGAQSQTVETTWTLGGDGTNYSGWEAIKVLTPNESTSNEANFTISCTSPPGGPG